MDEYIKLSDAKDEFYYALADRDCAISDYKEAYELLDGVEVADVRPVVTCEECVWHIDDGTHYCNKWCKPCPDNAEFFCAYGKRDNCGADMREVQQK